MSVAAILVMPVSLGFLESNTDVLERAAIDPDEEVVELHVAGPTTPSTAPPETTQSPRLPAVTTIPTAVTPHSSSFPLTVALPEMPNRPVRVLTVGDSTSASVGHALAEWSIDNSEFARTNVLWCAGCGFINEGTTTSWDAEFAERSREVAEETLPREVEELTPDLVMLMTTLADLTNRIWTDEEGILTPQDELYQGHLLDEYSEVTGRLFDLGVPNVVWIAPPAPTRLPAATEMTELERWDVMRDVLLTLEAENPGHITVIDLANWMDSTNRTDDSSWRPDGLHIAEQPAYELADEFLGPLLVRIALGLPAA
jgi:hypothetical protein